MFEFCAIQRFEMRLRQHFYTLLALCILVFAADSPLQLSDFKLTAG